MEQGNKSPTRLFAIAKFGRWPRHRGLQQQPKISGFERSAVNNSLTQNNLGAIHVSQDQDKGVITLTGTLPSDDSEIASGIGRQAGRAKLHHRR